MALPGRTKLRGSRWPRKRADRRNAASLGAQAARDRQTVILRRKRTSAIFNQNRAKDAPFPAICRQGRVFLGEA